MLPFCISIHKSSVSSHKSKRILRFLLFPHEWKGFSIETYLKTLLNEYEKYLSKFFSLTKKVSYFVLPHFGNPSLSRDGKISLALFYAEWQKKWRKMSCCLVEAENFISQGKIKAGKDAFLAMKMRGELG